MVLADEAGVAAAAGVPRPLVARGPAEVIRHVCSIWYSIYITMLVSHQWCSFIINFTPSTAQADNGTRVILGQPVFSPVSPVAGVVPLELHELVPELGLHRLHQVVRHVGLLLSKSSDDYK